MSGRFITLKKEIDTVLIQIASGSPRSVQERQKIMYAILQDLVDMHRLVPRLQAIRPPLIGELIHYWQTKSNHPNTIYRKMSTLRQVITKAYPQIAFPSNQVLGIHYQPTKPFIQVGAADILDDLDSPVIALIWRLQYAFGLKKQEALHFAPFMLNDKGLLLSRKASYNNCNRLIPYWNELQEVCLEQLSNLPANGFFGLGYSARALSYWHDYHLKQSDISQMDYFRHQYIITRFNHLTLTTDLSERQKLQYLRRELGYRENRQIKAILACQNVF